MPRQKPQKRLRVVWPYIVLQLRFVPSVHAGKPDAHVHTVQHISRVCVLFGRPLRDREKWLGVFIVSGNSG